MSFRNLYERIEVSTSTHLATSILFAIHEEAIESQSETSVGPTRTSVIARLRTSVN